MTYGAVRAPGTPLHITTWGRYASGGGAQAFQSTGAVSTASWTANRAIYVPMAFDVPLLLARFFWVNGSVTTDNIDCGIYDTNMAKIISTGSVARSGSSLTQYANVTDTLLAPGHYFLALASDGTGTCGEVDSASIQGLRTFGLTQQETAFPLPSSMTPITVTTTVYPGFGFTQDGTL
jgi:hypothetical protein